MKIEGNQKELDAMVEFHKGNRVEGLRLQEEFAAEFRKEYKDKDHCPCLKACRYHGNCKECVAIHRAHQEHVPNCMRPLINKKLKLMSELTEHTLANEIEAPHEILRKQASQIPVFGGRSMGLLDRLKSNKNNKDFFEWLDLLLKNELSSEIKAIIFNLYEDTDNKWSIELVGTFSFNKDNDDWA